MGHKAAVARLLIKDTDGLTMRDLVNGTGLTRHTLSVALAELKGEGRLSVRKVGAANLFFLKQTQPGSAEGIGGRR